MKKLKPKPSAAFGLILAQIPPGTTGAGIVLSLLNSHQFCPRSLWQSCPWDRARLLLGLSPSSALSQALQEGSGEAQEPQEWGQLNTDYCGPL